ncbi:MAG: hypothetical protein ABW217_06900 [Polyangiaceae bacterium]
MKPAASCSSDFTFDLLLSAGLEPAEEQSVREHLGACAHCAARLEQVKQQRDDFERNGPRLLLPTSKPAPSASGRRLARGAALASAGVLAGVLVGRAQLPSPVTRAKGAEHFQLYIRHGEEIREAGAHERVYPQDQLQFTYSAVDEGYVAVLSRDGAGTVSVYFPDASDKTWPAAAGQGRLLPGSTILDAVTGHERVYALHCQAPVSLGPLRAELAQARSLRAPSGCAMRVIELDKQAGP